jgi:TusA-related sulfurtransferase
MTTIKMPTKTSNFKERFLDITAFVCPMTFVRTKLLLEKMNSGEIAVVRLNDGEPLQNVPRSVREQGHEIISLEREISGADQGPYLLHIRVK